MKISKKNQEAIQEIVAQSVMNIVRTVMPDYDTTPTDEYTKEDKILLNAVFSEEGKLTDNIIAIFNKKGDNHDTKE